MPETTCCAIVVTWQAFRMTRARLKMPVYFEVGLLSPSSLGAVVNGGSGGVGSRHHHRCYRCFHMVS